MPISNKEFNLTDKGLKEKISSTSQVGGIETSVIDNGRGRGTRIAWINTGTGLRYKVVLDRAMDIADAFYNQYSFGWISNVGITSSQPFSNQGIDWLKTFGGGLLTTCGLTHIGGPESDEYGQRGLHGRISNIPAEIESIIQPDIYSDKLDFSITGIIRESTVFGPFLEMRRTISGKLGAAYLLIHDEITNRANTVSPHMLMYHFNFGWPLADEGAELILNGKMQYVNEERDKKIFNPENNFRRCSAPLDEHNGFGEAVAYFDDAGNEKGELVAGLINNNLGFGVTLTFNKKELPLLTNWQHWAKGEYVTGIEPCTNPPIGQARARKENTLLFIEPGETKKYTIRLDIIKKQPVN
jgi:hypothetical protein